MIGNSRGLKATPLDMLHFTQRMSRFSKSKISGYISQMAQTAVENPKHKSAFDNNDKFLYYEMNVRKNVTSPLAIKS